MADQIADESRQYVVEKASAYDGQPEDRAVSALAHALRQHLKQKGWNPADFQIDLDVIARNGLRRHRANQ
jgi:hypothetical protein